MGAKFGYCNSLHKRSRSCGLFALRYRILTMWVVLIHTNGFILSDIIFRNNLEWFHLTTLLVPSRVTEPELSEYIRQRQRTSLLLLRFPHLYFTSFCTLLYFLYFAFLLKWEMQSETQYEGESHTTKTWWADNATRQETWTSLVYIVILASQKPPHSALFSFLFFFGIRVL